MIGLVHGLFFRADDSIAPQFLGNYCLSRTYQGDGPRPTLHLVYHTPCIPPHPSAFYGPRDLPSVTSWISLPGHLPHVLPVASTHYPPAAAQPLHRIFSLPCIHIIRKLYCLMADTYPDITLIVSLIFSLFIRHSGTIFRRFLILWPFFLFSPCSFALTIVQDKIWYRQGEKRDTVQFRYDARLHVTTITGFDYLSRLRKSLICVALRSIKKKKR